MQKSNTKQENRNLSNKPNSRNPIGHASLIFLLPQLEHHQLIINNKSYRLIELHNFLLNQFQPMLLASQETFPLSQDTDYKLFSEQIPQSFGIDIKLYSSNKQLQKIIKEISHLIFHNLIRLKIRQNNITTIEAFQFIDAPKLKCLDFTYNPITIVNNALAKMVFDHLDQIFIDNRLIDQLKLEKWKMPPQIFVNYIYGHSSHSPISHYRKDISFCAKLQTINDFSGRLMMANQHFFLKASQATNRKINIFAALNRRTSPY